MKGRISCVPSSFMNETTRKFLLVFHPKHALTYCYSTLTPIPQLINPLGRRKT